jgi:cytochrome P450
LPPITGVVILDKLILSVNHADFLDDLYVNQTKYFTKSDHARYKYARFVPHTIYAKDTHGENYDQKRKIMTSSIWKSRLIEMTKTIKEVTMLEIKRHQTNPDLNVDLGVFTIDLYIRIIVNCVIGRDYSEHLVEYEHEDGKIELLQLQYPLNFLLKHSLKRPFTPMHLLFPFLQHYCILPQDRRYQRNVNRFKDLIKKMIADQLVELKDPTNKKARSTMLGIMLESELFNNNYDEIIDEVITMFFAGMKTI